MENEANVSKEATPETPYGGPYVSIGPRVGQVDRSPTLGEAPLTSEVTSAS